MLEAEARESVATLMARLRPFVERRVPVAADVDDVLQEVFLRMQRGLPGLRDADRFGPWLYRVVRNAINDRHRAQARAIPSADEVTEAGDDDADVTEGLSACIAPFVARLPSPYREAVTLVDLEGVAHKDAATMLGVSVPGVKSRVQRGRRKLRAMFDECCRLELDVRRRVVGYECRPGKDPRCGGPC
jgi:RNA polymerase sigma-70 factor, ECF subfamily